MSAHIMLPHLDSRFPGTLSKTVLQDYLRYELMYPGVIVSDDMEMHAITKNFGAEDAPVLALQAGCDLLCYRTEEAAKIAIEGIKKAIADKRLSEEELMRSVNRVRKVREKLKLAKNKMKMPDRLATIGHPDHAYFIQQKFAQE